MENWFSVSITLWPIVFIIILLGYWKTIGTILSNVSELTIGNFSLKLRKRMIMKVPEKQLEKLKSLSSRDLKFFFVVASQSWKIKKVEWNIAPDETLEIANKLEDLNLIKITNKDTAIEDRNVNSKLTGFGEDFYQELTSLIAESLNKFKDKNFI